MNATARFGRVSPPVALPIAVAIAARRLIDPLPAPPAPSDSRTAPSDDVPGTGPSTPPRSFSRDPPARASIEERVPRPAANAPSIDLPSRASPSRASPATSTTSSTAPPPPSTTSPSSRRDSRRRALARGGAPIERIVFPRATHARVWANSARTTRADLASPPAMGHDRRHHPNRYPRAVESPPRRVTTRRSASPRTTAGHDR